MACYGAVAARSGQLREVKVIRIETESQAIISWRFLVETVVEIANIENG